MMRSGILVCGGFSTRFGDDDKVRATLDGKPLIHHVATRLNPVTDELVVNCSAGQERAIATALSDIEGPVTYALDSKPDEGPMHGISQALKATDAEYTAVVACDMPFLDTDFVDYLFKRAYNRDAAVPREPGEELFQPLQAVYLVEALSEAVRQAEREHSDRMLDMIQHLDFVTIEGEELRSVADLQTFFNVNTKEDLERARELKMNEG